MRTENIKKKIDAKLWCMYINVKFNWEKQNVSKLIYGISQNESLKIPLYMGVMLEKVHCRHQYVK